MTPTPSSLRRPLRRALAAVALLGGAACAAPLAGSVHVPLGHDVRGTRVVLCDLDARGDCVPGTQQQQQITRQDGSSAWFRFDDAPTAPRGVVAWKDVNGNGTLDRGDLYGAYSIDGLTPAEVAAPYAGAVVWMRAQDGVADPFRTGAASAAPNGPARAAPALGELGARPRGDGPLTGTVIVPPGHDARGVVVLACVTGTDDCYSATQVALGGRSSRWRLDGLADVGHRIVAWSDVNGNGEVDGADLSAVYLNSVRDAPSSTRPGPGNLTLSLSPVHVGNAASRPSPKRGAANDAIFKDVALSHLAGRWTTQNRVKRLSQGFTSTTVFGGAAVQAGWDWTPTERREDVDLLVRPDGTFRSLTFTQDFQSENCATLTTVERVGKVRLAGARLTFEVTRGAFREIDTCQPGFNRWGPLPPAKETALAGLQAGPGGAAELVLRPGGAAGDLFFRRN